MAEIDSLELKISSEASSAIKSLDGIVQRLGLVTEGISAIGKNAGLSDFAKKVSLATKGINKSASDALKDFQGKFKTIDVKIDFSKPEAELKKFQNQAETAQNALTRIMASSTADSQIKSIEKWSISLAQANNAIEQIQDKLSETAKLEYPKPKLSEYEDDITQHLKSVGALGLLSEYLDEIKNSTQQATESARDFTNAFNPDAMTAVFGEAINGIEEAEQHLENLSGKINGMKNLFTQTLSDLKSGDLLSYLSKNINDYIKAAQTAAGIKIYTEDYKKILNDIERTENTIEKFRQKQADLQAVGISEENKEWQELAAKITVAETQLDSFVNKRSEMESKGEDIRFSGGLANQSWLKSAGAVASAELSSVSEKVREIGSAVSQAVGRIPIIGRVAKEAAFFGKKAFADLKFALSSIVSMGGKTIAAISAITTGIKKLTSGIRSVISKISSMIKSLIGIKSASNGINASFSGSLKTLLKYGLGIRSLYALFNKLRNAIKEGMKNLVLYSSETNASVSLLKKSLTQLKNASASMVAPLLNAIAPALNQIIQICIRATNAINQLLSALTGSTTWIRAKKLTDNFADSLNGATEAAKTMTLGIDELNIIGDDSGGAGGGAILPDNMFETVGIENNFKSFAAQLKEMWENMDFTELGALLGIKLKNALDSISWEPIKKTAAGIGKSIGTLINGFVEVDGLADSIGQTIGEAINTGITGINSILDDTHFDSIGIFVGDGLNRIVNTVDWEGIGHLFAEKWNALFEIIGNAAATFDWANFALGLSNGVNTAIADFNWAENAAKIGNLANGILESINTLFENTDWAEIGSGLAVSINSVFSSVDWEEAGKTLINGFNSVISLIGTTIAETDWYAVATDLMDMLEGAINNIDWENLGQIISDTLIGLLDIALAVVGETDWGKVINDMYSGIGKAIENIDLAEILLKITALIAELFAQIPGIILGVYAGQADLIGSIFETIGLDGVAGFFKGISDKLSDGQEWLKENLVDPVVNWVKELFGIHSPSTVFAEIGTFLMQGLYNGITALVEKVLSVFTKIKDKIINIWNAIKTKTSEIWSGIENLMKTSINSIIGFINKMLDGVGSGINSMIDALNSISFDIPDWVPGFGGKSFSLNIPKINIPKIPQFAYGGITLSHTFAEISEHNRPEAILPLSNHRAMSMIADSIIENVNYGQGAHEGDIKGMIREAVHEEVSYLAQTLVPYLGSISQNTKETAEKDMSVQIGDRDIVRAYDRGRSSMGARLLSY